MSTTISPVTQRADVAVKKQFNKSVEVPSLLEKGKDSKRAPITIVTKKLPSIIFVEFNFII